jgi:hypothetical protein
MSITPMKRYQLIKKNVQITKNKIAIKYSSNLSIILVPIMKIKIVIIRKHKTISAKKIVIVLLVLL